MYVYIYRTPMWITGIYGNMNYTKARDRVNILLVRNGWSDGSYNIARHMKRITLPNGD